MYAIKIVKQLDTDGKYTIKIVNKLDVDGKYTLESMQLSVREFRVSAGVC